MGRPAASAKEEPESIPVSSPSSSWSRQWRHQSRSLACTLEPVGQARLVSEACASYQHFKIVFPPSPMCCNGALQQPPRAASCDMSSEVELQQLQLRHTALSYVAPDEELHLDRLIEEISELQAEEDHLLDRRLPPLQSSPPAASVVRQPLVEFIVFLCSLPPSSAACPPNCLCISPRNARFVSGVRCVLLGVG